MFLLTPEDIKRETAPALEYISLLWEKLTGNARSGRREALHSWSALASSSLDGHLDDQNHKSPHILYLPYDYVYPGGRFIVQFYWDTYFILLSLILNNRIELAKGMIENCFYSIDQYGAVLANRKRWASGSQLPFLANMISDLFEVTNDHDWLRKAVVYAEKEVSGYWLDAHHLCHCGLSRYHALPHFPETAIPAITLDHEATWDLSPRFDLDDVLHLLPVDLNCNLLMYERAIGLWHQALGNIEAQAHWEEKAVHRRNTICELMWNDKDGLFYDYDFILGRQKKIKSLAAYFSLYTGVADERQALRLRDNLSLFEKDHGLVTCDHDYGYQDRQWNYPLGWAPLHWIVFKGLKRYGFDEDAQRIALKWLSVNLAVWRDTGKFFEKYDVVEGSHRTLSDR
jgi:alpha,alpha-trehalase